MRTFKIIICLCICLLINKQSYSQDKKIASYLSKSDTLLINSEEIIIPRRIIIPDHNRFQFAGAIGCISAGFGYNIGKRYEITFMLGLENEFFGGSKETIVTTSIKNTFNLFHPFKINNNISFIPTAGLSINWGFTNNTFNSLPSHYPDSYYFQNKIHAAPFIGGKFRYDLNIKNCYKRAIELYFELGSLDAYIIECVRTDYVGINDIMNLAIGISIYFE